METRPVFYPLHIMPPYKKYIKSGVKFPNADYVSQNGLSLPSSVTLSDSELDSIETAINSIFNARQMSIA